MSGWRQRWPQQGLLLALLLFWLLLALLGGSWLLAYERASMQGTLDEDARQIAVQMRDRLERLQQAAQQLLLDVSRLQQMEAGTDPGHYMNKLRADFPLLQRVALLRRDVRNHGLPLSVAFPALTADGAALPPDLAEYPAVAARLPQLAIGQAVVLPWQEHASAATHLLLLPGTDGSVLALWLPPSGMLPTLPATSLRLGWQAEGYLSRTPTQLYAHTEIRSGPFLLQLELTRRMEWAEMHSPRLWLLLSCLLLALLVSIFSYQRFGMLRQQRQQLLQAQAAWLTRQSASANAIRH